MMHTVGYNAQNNVKKALQQMYYALSSTKVNSEASNITPQLSMSLYLFNSQNRSLSIIQTLWQSRKPKIMLTKLISTFCL